MIDLQTLKAQVDLLALVERHTTLKRVASSGGGEWAGPCPFCGGQDRFRVQPAQAQGGRWLCRNCTEGKWKDSLEFGKRIWPQLPFLEVCKLLGGKEQTGRSIPSTSAGLRIDNPAYQAPDQDWQLIAHGIISTCEQALWSDQGLPARRYLSSRGLHPETLRAWHIGYSAGFKVGEAWVGRGILLPCMVGGEVWYLKIALLPGQRLKCERCGRPALARQPCPGCGATNKYRGVRGSRTAAIYGADELPGSALALLVEGEFDTLIAWQELREVIAVCTLGSAGNRLDLAKWGAYLLPVQHLLVTYDADVPGQRGAGVLAEMSERVRICRLPQGAKDINEFVQQGGELWPWLKAELIRLALI